MPRLELNFVFPIRMHLGRELKVFKMEGHFNYCLYIPNGCHCLPPIYIPPKGTDEDQLGQVRSSDFISQRFYCWTGYFFRRLLTILKKRVRAEGKRPDNPSGNILKTVLKGQGSKHPRQDLQDLKNEAGGQAK